MVDSMALPFRTVKRWLTKRVILATPSREIPL
jgi:hypothetical protein